MVRRSKFILIIAFVFVLAFTGCTGSKNPGGDNPVKNSPSPAVTAPVSGEVTETPVAKEEVAIYYLKSDSLQISSQQIKIDPSKTTLFDLCEQICDTLADESFVIDIKGADFVKYDGKVMAIVNFTEKGAPGNSASKYERQLLDCIAQSIIENYESVDAVGFRIEGKNYETENVKLGDNEAYMRK